MPAFGRPHGEGGQSIQPVLVRPFSEHIQGILTEGPVDNTRVSTESKPPLLALIKSFLYSLAGQAEKDLGQTRFPFFLKDEWKPLADHLSGVASGDFPWPESILGS